MLMRLHRWICRKLMGTERQQQYEATMHRLNRQEAALWREFDQMMRRLETTATGPTREGEQQ
jgi:hypothetical protein